MPGRSPNEAIEAFIDPLRTAVACLGGAHFTLTPGARGDVGVVHQWVLNGDDPLDMGDGYFLRASMHFEVVDQRQAPANRRFKVKTRGYAYHVITADNEDIVAYHWHPEGSSPWVTPHMHVGDVALANTGVFPKRAHIPTPRASFESVIAWVITELGVKPVRDDWAEVLSASERDFDEHKSWP